MNDSALNFKEPKFSKLSEVFAKISFYNDIENEKCNTFWTFLLTKGELWCTRREEYILDGVEVC